MHTNTAPIQQPSFVHIAGYKFISLQGNELENHPFQTLCETLALKGTILLSHEGININLAGTPASIQSFQKALQADPRFADISFHRSFTAQIPYNQLKIKIKPEIITLHQPHATPIQGQRAPDISPQELKQWLDEKRDFTLLDTRNDYEVRFGTFTGAVNLHIADFGELPSAIQQLNRDKPIVMFCTGGIRCEKAALHLIHQGFSSVYQLDGGILGYFNQVGGDHYQGECFVFDQRISVNSQLEQTGTVQCTDCQGPITEIACPACTT